MSGRPKPPKDPGVGLGGGSMGRSVLDQLLELPEGLTLEFKRAEGDNRSKLKTVVAFLNTEGGLLVIGLEDAEKAPGRERILGVQGAEESIDDFRRMVRQQITPSPLEVPGADPVFHVVPCELRDGAQGSVFVVQVPKSSAVHSIVDGGTYARLGKSNRQLSAAEISGLAMARGVHPWVNGTADVSFDLLESNWWREYSSRRRFTRGTADAMLHIGLAKKDAEGVVKPLRAAVLLFAEEPSGLLDWKCAVRVFQYSGEKIERSPNTNLIRPPRTITGPIVEQVRGTMEAISEAFAAGVQKGPLGFEIIQKYPRRVLEEAVTNALIHRDYGVPNDVHVRIFENRIEIESPGRLPSSVTLRNIGTIGSRPRNRQLAQHLREFPHPPNLDAGEGVPMMIDVMTKSNLYPPIHLAPPDWPNESVLLVCFNEARPSHWDQVAAHLTQHADIGNAEVRRLLRTDDPLLASRMLRNWVRLGLLVPVDPAAAKQHRRYRRPGGAAGGILFSEADG